MSAVVSFFGYLGKDAELSKDGKQHKYNVGVRGRKSKDGGEPETQWFTCWHYAAPEKLIQYLVKGTPVFISGELSASAAEGKQGGVFLNLNVNVRSFDLAGKASGGGGSTRGDYAPRDYPPPSSGQLSSAEIDELPF